MYAKIEEIDFLTSKAAVNFDRKLCMPNLKKSIFWHHMLYQGMFAVNLYVVKKLKNRFFDIGFKVHKNDSDGARDALGHSKNGLRQFPQNFKFFDFLTQILVKFWCFCGNIRDFIWQDRCKVRARSVQEKIKFESLQLHKNQQMGVEK